MQRRRSTRSLKEGRSVNVSARAFIIRLPILGSAAQCGINPQCMSLHSLPSLCRTMTGIVGEICSGAMLKRGVYFGRSRSRFQRTRMSPNSNVAVNRPHIYEFLCCVFEGRLSTHALHKSSPCCSACFLVLKIRRFDSSRLISIVWFRSRSKTSPREYDPYSGAGTATP
jgi:hypothetical protein